MSALLWLDIESTARRVGRDPRHVRRLARHRLAPLGLAKLVPGNVGRRSHWLIRSDWRPVPRASDEPAAQAVSAGCRIVGMAPELPATTVTIEIHAPGHVVIHVVGSGSKVV